jgi:hypothetical protein
VVGASSPGALRGTLGAADGLTAVRAFTDREGAARATEVLAAPPGALVEVASARAPVPRGRVAVRRRAGAPPSGCGPFGASGAESAAALCRDSPCSSLRVTLVISQLARSPQPAARPVFKRASSPALARGAVWRMSARLSMLECIHLAEVECGLHNAGQEDFLVCLAGHLNDKTDRDPGPSQRWRDAGATLARRWRDAGASRGRSRTTIAHTRRL